MRTLKQHIAAGVLCALLLLSMATVMYYPLVAHSHHCVGEHCVTCALEKQVKQLSRGFRSTPPASLQAVMVAFPLVMVQICTIFLVFCTSLLHRKVRFDN